MAVPESLSPRGDAAASGFDPMPGPFTGLARDFPGPQEGGAVAGLFFELQPAGQAAEPSPPGLGPESPAAFPSPLSKDFSGLELSVVPQETAFSLQQLTAALVRPLQEPAAAPPGPMTADVSLTMLADQLTARFTGPAAADGDIMDLMSAPVALAPPEPLKAPPPPAKPGHLPMAPPDVPKSRRRDQLPPPTSPGSPAAIRAAAGALSSPPKTAAPAVPVAPAAPVAPSRQGDVFFLSPLGTSSEQGPVEDAVEPLDFFSADARHPLLAGAPPSPVAAGSPPGTSTLLPPSPLVGRDPAAFADDRGTGLLLGGAGLILLGIFLACRLPLLWLDLDGAAPWPRQKTEASLILHAAGALLALGLGAGSVLLCRWAPPLIHAAGWLAVFTAALVLGVAGIHLGAEPELVLSASDVFLLVAGLMVPLAYVFYYEKDSAREVCAAADPVPCWTDRQTDPGLMVLWCGLILAVGAAAMLRHQPAFPVPPARLLTGLAAQAAWAGLLMAGLLIMLCAWFRRPAANWLLLLAALGLAGTLGVCGFTGGPVWDSFLAALGQPADAGAPDSMLPLLAGLAPAILFLVLAMARRAFVSPPPS